MKRRSLLMGTAALATPLGWSMPARAGHLVRKGASDSPTVSVIIDDVGFSDRALAPFLRSRLALTFAVLPRLPRTEFLAAKVSDYGFEVMLHQPMQPRRRDVDPGRAALKVGDSPARIADVIAANLEQLPRAIGVNNHMGSRFTAHASSMDIALRSIEQAGLFFVDSRTSRRSAAGELARHRGMRSASRDVFLDNVRETWAIERQLDALVRIARRNGTAVGIGHPYPQTAQALERFAARVELAGVNVVAVSRIVRS